MELPKNIVIYSQNNFNVHTNRNEFKGILIGQKKDFKDAESNPDYTYIGTLSELIRNIKKNTENGNKIVLGVD